MPIVPAGVVTWAEIDLDAIAHNVEAIKAFVGPDVQIIASVKANAYGHGLRPVARVALEAGASQLAVHRIQAAVALRQAIPTAPILLMGHIPPSGIDLVLHHDITPTVVDLETARLISDRATRSVGVHVKVDTGMSRYGLEPSGSSVSSKRSPPYPHLRPGALFALRICRRCQPGLREAPEGALSSDPSRSRKRGLRYPLPHICNSAGLIAMPEANLAAVRPGLLVYGMAPSRETQPPFELQRALTLKSTVTKVRDLQPGATISYGGTFVATHPMRVALVTMGYGDGYPRLLSNRGQVLIRGQRAPIRGRICMDQMVVEVTDIAGVEVGDEAVAIGCQGDAEITAEEVAGWAQTINYEIVTGLLPQVVRVYRRNGTYPSPNEGLDQWASYLSAV